MKSSWPADIKSAGPKKSERERGIEVDFEILNLIASLRFLALRFTWVGLPLLGLGNAREGLSLGIETGNCLVQEAFRDRITWLEECLCPVGLY